MSVFLYGLAVVSLFLADSGRAPEGAAGEKCPAIDPAALALRVFVDRRTGQLRPPQPAEAAKLSALLTRDARTYPVVVLPDGTKLVDLDDAFMNYVYIQRAPDGSVQSRCVTEGSNEAARPLP